MSLIASMACQNIFAQWNQNEKQILKKYPENSFPSPGYATLWAGFHSINKTLSVFFQSKRKKIQTKDFKHPLEYSLAIQRGRFRKPIKAPLIIIGNAIFRDDKSDRAVQKDFYKRGFHVVSLPTGLSEPYFKAHPISFKPGDMFAEAKANVEVIRKIKEQIGLSLIEETHYWGASYGATIGAYTRYFDERNNSQVIDGKYFLVAPITDVYYALSEFDNMVEEYHGKFNNNKTKFTVNLLNSYIRFRKTDIPNHTEEKFVHASRSLTGGIVQRALRIVTRSFDDLSKKNILSRSKGEDKRFSFRKKKYFGANDKEIDDLKMQDLLEYLLPEVERKMKSYQGKLVYWIRETEKLNPKSELKALLSYDDPLLNPAQFRHFERHPSFHILKTGGHLGYACQDWYSELVDEVF